MISYAAFPILGNILCLRIVHGIAWGLDSTASSTIASDEIPQKICRRNRIFALITSLSTAIAPTM